MKLDGTSALGKEIFNKVPEAPKTIEQGKLVGQLPKGKRFSAATKAEELVREGLIKKTYGAEGEIQYSRFL